MYSSANHSTGPKTTLESANGHQLVALVAVHTTYESPRVTCNLYTFLFGVILEQRREPFCGEHSLTESRRTNKCMERAIPVFIGHRSESAGRPSSANHNTQNVLHSMATHYTPLPPYPFAITVRSSGLSNPIRPMMTRIGLTNEIAHKHCNS
jgi:hypothetical protein